MKRPASLKYTWRARLVFMVVFLTIAIFFAMGIAFFSSTSNLIFHAKEKELQRAAQRTSDNLGIFLFERQGDLAVMTASPLLGSQTSLPVQQAYLDSVRNIYQAYDSLAICQWVPQEQTLLPLSFSGAFNQQEASRALTATAGDYSARVLAMTGPKTDIVFYMVHPLEQDESSAKLLVAKLSNAAVTRIIAAGALGDAGFAALRDPAGQLFLANLPQLDAASLPWGGSAHQLEIYHRGETIGVRLPLPPDLLGAGWSLVCMQGADEAFAITEKIKSYSLAVFIFSICVLVLISIVNSDAVMRPLQTMEESLERSRHLAALGEMAAGVVHEVRNPLTSIRGYAQYLSEEDESLGSKNEELKWIMAEVDRLERMLSRLLSFAHPLEPHLQEVNLNQLISEVLVLLRKEPRLAERSLVFAPHQVPLLRGDDDQIRQLLYNLLTNAIRATAMTGKITITALPQEEEKFVLLEISDDGVGIPLDDQERIFQPFVSLDKHGTGLGLPIVARIVHGHGGYLHLTSKPGEGTTVSVYLPAIRRKVS